MNTEAIKKLIQNLVVTAPENRLIDFRGTVIFDSPLIGIINGDDSIFEDFQEEVSLNHLLPRNILQRHSKKNLNHVSVISWALPFSQEIRNSNHVIKWPSSLYSLARNNGGALIYRMSQQLVEILRNKGISTVSPMLTEEYDAFRTPKHIFSSTWSERHVAYAAGLGHFGLNGSLITPRGSNVRFGSIVTNLRLDQEFKNRSSPFAPCLSSEGKECSLCLDRCPVGALSMKGMDKALCYQMRKAIRERSLKQYLQKFHMLTSPIVKSGERKWGYSLGCALCQCGVPCEGADPFLQG